MTSSLNMGGVREESNRLERVPTVEVPARSTPGGPPASRRFVVLAGGALVALLLPAFIALGQWQWHKAAVKTARQALFDARSAEPPVRLTAAAVDAEAMRYRRISVRGVYEAQRQVLIDNRVHQEQPGYHVLTPLRIEGDTSATDGRHDGLRVLVNRGWVPVGRDRRQLPAIDTPGGAVELTAIAIVPGDRFFTLAAEVAADGREAPGMPVWQNLDLAHYRRQVDFPLQPVVLLLDPDSAGGGFVRDWPRPDERSARHLGYAWQWFGFAAATVGIWLYYLLRPYWRRR